MRAVRLANPTRKFLFVLDWLDVCNKYIIFTLTLVGCIECVAVTWVRESQGKFLAADIEKMIGRAISPLWHVFWKFVCPPILGLLFITSMGVEIWVRQPPVALPASNSKPPRLQNIADTELPAPIVLFGWALALLPTLLLTAFFLREDAKGATAQPQLETPP